MTFHTGLVVCSNKERLDANRNLVNVPPVECWERGGGGEGEDVIACITRRDMAIASVIVQSDGVVDETVEYRRSTLTDTAGLLSCSIWKVYWLDGRGTT